MGETTKYFVVKQKAIPEVLLKVVEAKRLLESEKVLTIQEAVDAVGISRSSFYKYKDDIESKTGMTFDWQRLDDKKASRVLYKIHGLNFDNHTNYHDLMEEIITKILVMRKVFKDYLVKIA